MNKWLVVGTDQRLLLAADLLNQAGHSCRYVAIDSFAEELQQTLLAWQPDRIILPLLSMAQPIPPTLLQRSSVLYTGQIAQQWVDQLDEIGIHHRSYLLNEQFIWQNAQLTAEAFVHVFYAQTKRTIAGKHFYVAGLSRKHCIAYKLL
ncbi:hypothetical protein ORD22_00105 [Sporosarcina sp. GW1-11]|uniref:hypothetical protein n=1 Tax=Sporosarcina sp. GW1-11 TaxID=2899126 RepID=UPI00294E32B8|nr:hypothetical protein [Sporosarcina sp. GW1-11]MDV6376665.1 hypothetical protein [Sporosarcina sp. GW1-11]